MVEFSSPSNEETLPEQTLSVDGASYVKGSDARIILEAPNSLLIKQTLQF